MHIKKDMKLQIDMVTGIHTEKKIDSALTKKITQFCKSKHFISVFNSAIEFFMIENLFRIDKYINKKKKIINIPNYIIELKFGDVKKVKIDRNKKKAHLTIITKLVKNGYENEKYNSFCKNRTINGKKYTVKSCPSLAYHGFTYIHYDKYPVKKMVNIIVEGLLHSFYAGGIMYPFEKWRKLNVEILPIKSIKTKVYRK